MTAARQAELVAAPLAYLDVGVTTTRGRDVASWQRTIRRGGNAFDSAVDALLSWQAEAGAGLRVEASDGRVRVGSLVDLYLGIAQAALRAPCRVVTVLDEPRRRGFAYGTLPEHPESGEEAFVIEQTANEVVFSVRVSSRPATLLARAGGPVTRLAQHGIIRRYLRALDR
jgi:uncharacterized protein (UPF0548 family)